MQNFVIKVSLWVRIVRAKTFMQTLQNSITFISTSVAYNIYLCLCTISLRTNMPHLFDAGHISKNDSPKIYVVCIVSYPDMCRICLWTDNGIKMLRRDKKCTWSRLCWSLDFLPIYFCFLYDSARHNILDETKFATNFCQYDSNVGIIFPWLNSA